MRRLIKHINILLAEHDFLVITGIGGFVARSKSASVCLSGTTHTWTPPQREISFNPVIKHDDGLLLESYLRLEKMSAAKAESSIRKEIEQLKNTLWTEKEVELGPLGKLTCGEDDHIEFVPSAASSLSYRNFGLSPVTLQVLQPVQPALEIVKSIPLEDDYIQITIPRKTFYRAVGSVAAILVAALLCIPVSLNRNSTFSAAIVPLPVEQQIASPSQPESTDTAKEADPSLTTSEQSAPPTPSSANTLAQKNYFIIVSSCTSVKEAQPIVDKLIERGNATAGLVEKGDRVRVYIGKFDNREEAERELNSVRKEKKEFENAWLFITR